MSDDAGIQLQVANMRPQDAGASVARLTTSVMATIGLKEGDLVELIGKRQHGSDRHASISGRRRSTYCPTRWPATCKRGGD